MDTRDRASNGGTPVYTYDDAPPTMALGPGSAAIDQGDPAGCTDSNGEPLPTVARCAGRVGRCDLGAYEDGGSPAMEVFSDGFETGTTLVWTGSSE